MTTEQIETIRKALEQKYEIKGSYTTEELIAKKAAALGKGMVVRFICSSADYPFISKAVGEDYTLKRGSAKRDGEYYECPFCGESGKGRVHKEVKWCKQEK